MLNKFIKQKESEQEIRKQKVNLFLIRYFKWFTVFVIFVFLGLSYFFILNPKYEKIVEIVEYVSGKKNTEFVDKQEYSQKLSDIISFYNSLDEKEKNKIAIMLPKKDFKDRFFTQIEHLVLSKGYVLNYLKISEVAGETKQKVVDSDNKTVDMPDSIGEINLSLAVSGVDYYGMKTLLKVIENNLRIMDISSLSFDPDNKRVTLEISTYYLK